MKKLIAMIFGLALTAGAGTAFSDHGEKIEICHKGKTISVHDDTQTRDDHSGHGDALEACPE